MYYMRVLVIVSRYTIFGDNMEFLRADGSTVPSQAKQGGYGIYRCEVCYDSKDGVRSCNSSKLSNEVIGTLENF